MWRASQACRESRQALGEILPCRSTASACEVAGPVENHVFFFGEADGRAGRRWGGSCAHRGRRHFYLTFLLKTAKQGPGPRAHGPNGEWVVGALKQKETKTERPKQSQKWCFKGVHVPPGHAPLTLLFLVKNGDRGQKAHDQFDTFMLWLLTKWGFWGGPGWVKKLFFFVPPGPIPQILLLLLKKPKMKTRGLKAHTHIWGHGGARWRRALTKWSFWGGPGWVQNGSTFFLCHRGPCHKHLCSL